MPRSLGDVEDQGAKVPSAMGDRRHRARSGSQPEELAVTPGQPDTPTHLRARRLTRCAKRPSQRVAPGLVLQAGSRSQSPTRCSQGRKQAMSYWEMATPLPLANDEVPGFPA